LYIRFAGLAFVCTVQAKAVQPYLFRQVIFRLPLLKTFLMGKIQNERMYDTLLNYPERQIYAVLFALLHCLVA